MSMKRSLFRRAAVGLGAVTVAATGLLIGAGTASADTPKDGQLCDAAENIQFYANDFHTPSYTVQRGEQIRIDSMNTLVGWAQGHGTGHSARYFIWEHSNGVDRVVNCRYT